MPDAKPQCFFERPAETELGAGRLLLVSYHFPPGKAAGAMRWQKFARHSFMRIRRAIAMVNGEYNQNITGVRVVESFNRQEANMEHFDELNSEHLNANLEASRYSGALQPFHRLTRLAFSPALGADIGAMPFSPASDIS